MRAARAARADDRTGPQSGPPHELAAPDPPCQMSGAGNSKCRLRPASGRVGKRYQYSLSVQTRPGQASRHAAVKRKEESSQSWGWWSEKGPPNPIPQGGLSRMRPKVRAADNSFARGSLPAVFGFDHKPQVSSSPLLLFSGPPRELENWSGGPGPVDCALECTLK